MDNIVFFRNDDVRDILDKSLVDITNLFIRYNIPISQAVEPANVTKEVVKWLISLKEQYPELIEITQHGYDHGKKNKYYNQEFGGARKYHDQYEDIRKGKELMDKYFGDLWTPIFTFPYGIYNKYTLQAINKLGYIGISSGLKYNFKAITKNRIGNFCNLDTLWNKTISYHNKKRRRYNFYEISVSVNIIKRHIGYDTAEHFSYGEVIKNIEHNLKYTNIIGVLFHHRFHTKHLDLIEEIIRYSIQQKFKFSTIKSLINGKI